MKKGWKVVAGLAAGALCVGVALPACTSQTKSGQPEANAKETQQVDQKATVHRGYAAAHGDKCFTEIVVATAEDGTILATYIDDYQFMAAGTAGLTPVPNSDAGFAAGYAPAMVLVSKSVNNEVYSANMKEKAASTQPWLTSMKAIEKSTIGKKPADLEKVKPDAVSGATLVDMPNYLKAVAEVAQSGAIVSEGTYQGSGEDLKLGAKLAGAHGDKCFTSAVTLVQGDTIVATTIDDFQFMDAAAAGITPVPNSTGGFAAGYAPGKVLVSKAVNSAVYSKSLKEKGGATQDWIVSMDAIEAHLAGTSINDKPIAGPDAVSGATLVDTANYAKAAVDAAKAA